MLPDLFNGESLGAIVAEHFYDEVLELGGQVQAAQLAEVLFELALYDEAVEVVVFFGFLEGKDAVHENEEDDAQGEDIDLAAIILFAFMHLCAM